MNKGARADVLSRRPAGVLDSVRHVDAGVWGNRINQSHVFYDQPRTLAAVDLLLQDVGLAAQDSVLLDRDGQIVVGRDASRDQCDLSAYFNYKADVLAAVLAILVGVVLVYYGLWNLQFRSNFKDWRGWLSLASGIVILIRCLQPPDSAFALRNQVEQ